MRETRGCRGKGKRYVSASNMNGLSADTQEDRVRCLHILCNFMFPSDSMALPSTQHAGGCSQSVVVLFISPLGAWPLSRSENISLRARSAPERFVTSATAAHHEAAYPSLVSHGDGHCSILISCGYYECRAEGEPLYDSNGLANQDPRDRLARSAIRTTHGGPHSCCRFQGDNV